MREAKYTPGPWGIQRYLNYEGFSIWSESSSLNPPHKGCIVERWEDGMSEERAAVMLANARLIAAAPELVEALKAVMERAENEYHTLTDGHGKLADYPEFVAARAALKKAGAL